MKHIIIFLLFINPAIGLAQSTEIDLDLIQNYSKGKKSNIDQSNFKAPAFNGFYKKYFKNQALNDCKFETKCTQYCKSNFKKYGIIKGLFMSTDRLIRCDRITNATASPYRINQRGKMIDHIEEYQDQ